GGDLLFQLPVRPAHVPLEGVQREQGDLTCVHMLLLLRFVVSCAFFFLKEKESKRTLTQNFVLLDRFCLSRPVRMEGGRPGVPPLRKKRSQAHRRGRTLAGPPYPGTAGGASPSPTVLKKLFRDWVGEALGPPAGGMPRGHPHPSRFACHLPP